MSDDWVFCFLGSLDDCFVDDKPASSKICHLGLSVVDAAAQQPIAASVASIASVASTPQPVAEHNPLDCTLPQAPGVDHAPIADSASAPGSQTSLAQAGVNYI